MIHKQYPRLREELHLYLANRFPSLPVEFVGDAIEEAYTALLLRPVPGLESDLNKLRSWLWTVSIRRLSYYSKRTMERMDLVSVKELPADTDVESTIEIKLTIEQLINALPKGLRKVALLHFLEGLSIGEVASELGISSEAAKKRCFRAMSHMRRNR